jgi:plastocyanin domain-containing protein
VKDFGLNQPLPLDEAVTVTVTPKRAGSHRLACAMGMIAGALQVEEGRRAASTTPPSGCYGWSPRDGAGGEDQACSR